jgi:hypothetical protein
MAARSVRARYRFSLLLPAVLGCTLLWGAESVHAQMRIQSRTVPSGEPRQLAFLTSLNPDCSVNGEMTVRVIKQPGHGTAEAGRGVGYPSYRYWDARYRCNRILSEGYQVIYTSNENFKGDDGFEIEFFGPAGHYTVTRYAVAVK